jgi:hypothetical protein
MYHLTVSVGYGAKCDFKWVSVLDPMSLVSAIGPSKSSVGGDFASRLTCHVDFNRAVQITTVGFSYGR